MALLRRIARAGTDAARLATGAAALVAAPAVIGVGLLGETASVARAGVGLARSAAVRTTRAVGTLVTGADPLPGGHLHDLADAAKGMVEPPSARHTRRVWGDRDRVQIELAADDDTPEAKRSLRRHLERLEGVEWATVNDVVGRVLVAVDTRRVGVEDVVGVITEIEQARGGTGVFPQRPDHPADLEPLLAAVAAAAVDTAAVGVAALAKVLPIPALTRHATLLMALLDTQQWLKQAVTDRIGPVGTDLVFEGTSALLHSLTQSPTVPALNAAAAIQHALEIRARRQVWRRRERELCLPEREDDDAEPLQPPGPRPATLPAGPIETYRSRLDPTELAASLGLLALTRRPGRSADLLKALTPRAAVFGRESFAATLDLLLSRDGVLPLDGSAYRRLDRVDTVVVDGAALCTGPPVVVEATGEADAWDDAAVWTAATRLLAGGSQDGVRLGPPRTADAPGGEIRSLLQGRRRVGTVTVAPELDPRAEALLNTATDAGLRPVLTAHVGAREIAGLADDVVGGPLVEIVRSLQEEGHGVLLVSATDGPALLAADVAVAPVLEGRAPAWGADLVTSPGLADACRIVTATADARAFSRRAAGAALTGNVLGGLLAAVGSPRYGQRKATTPGKWATATTMANGTWAAVRAARRPMPPPTVHTPWHALEPDDVLRRLADLPDEPERPATRSRLAALGPVRFARTVAAELSDPLTPVLATGAAATAVLGDATDAILVGSVTVINALVSGLQRLRAETALEELLLEQDSCVRRETDGAAEEVPATALRVGDVVLVEAGDVVGADARLLEAADLEVDESGLTGESLSVAKSLPATPGADVADRTCMLFDGTTVVAGRGRAVVVAVGQATQAGRAARAAGGAAPPAGVQARL
ncbi:UNVERIFIED_ORG: cation-translocating P-type ATPase, partial [Bacillus sp. AZ43]